MNLIALPEVAHRLDVSVPTVRRLIASGKLRAVAERGCLRVREVDLHEHIEQLPTWSQKPRAKKKLNGEARPETTPEGEMVETPATR